jgi:hypothetical protein
MRAFLRLPSTNQSTLDIISSAPDVGWKNWLEWVRGFPPIRQEKVEWMGHGAFLVIMNALFGFWLAGSAVLLG